MTSLVFEEFHNREVWLIPIEYHDNTDTGMRLDPFYDPIGSNRTIRLLNSTYFPGQDRRLHITL